jgi:transcriptional regulator with PAS, ATPase and Fis domain
MDTIQAIKQRFEIIGNEPKLNRAIESHSSCPTDISVLVVGESGVGKKVFQKSYIRFLIENMGSTLP